MRLPKFFAILFCSVAANLFGQNELFEQANTAYENLEYKQAVNSYLALEKEGFSSANLFYNMGNAYYNLDEVGKSILYFEKALKVEPNLKDAKHNLQLAYLKSDNQIEPLPKLFIVEWWQSLLSKKSASTWAWQGVIFIWLAIVLLILYRWKKMTWSKVLGILILLFGLSYICLAWQKYNYDYKHQFAIVLPEKVALKNSPNLDGENVLLAFEGLRIEIVDQVDDWYQIRLEDGTDAWLLKETVALI